MRTGVVPCWPLVAAVLVSGCLQQRQDEPRVPIRVQANQCRPVAFKALEFSLPAGAVAGWHKGGLPFMDWPFPHFWSAFKKHAEGLAYEKAAARDLSLAGYRVAQPSVADVCIVGTVDNAGVDSAAWGSIAECRMDITWRVIDRNTQQVLYVRQTVGLSTSVPIAGESFAHRVRYGFGPCFRQAFCNLLSDPGFVRAVSVAAESPP